MRDGLTTMLRCVLLATVAGAMVSLSASVAADSPAPGSLTSRKDDIRACVKDLASDDFARRDAAHNRLARLGDFDLAAAADVLRQPGLTAEQRERVLTVARSVFDRTPRGALGVLFDTTFFDRQRLNLTPGSMPVNEVTGPVISQVYDGFPAKGVLKPGDEIVSINGRRVNGALNARGFTTVRCNIVSRDPGQVVTVRVKRTIGGEPPLRPGVTFDDRGFSPRIELDLEVELGSFETLNRLPNSATNRMMPDELNMAWAVRVRDLCDVAAPVGPTEAEIARIAREDSLAGVGEPPREVPAFVLPIGEGIAAGGESKVARRLSRFGQGIKDRNQFDEDPVRNRLALPDDGRIRDPRIREAIRQADAQAQALVQIKELENQAILHQTMINANSQRVDAIRKARDAARQGGGDTANMDQMLAITEAEMRQAEEQIKVIRAKIDALRLQQQR